MPVPRPAYGRKPGPFVTPPDANSKTAKAKAAAKQAAIEVAVLSPSPPPSC